MDILWVFLKHMGKNAKSEISLCRTFSYTPTRPELELSGELNEQRGREIHSQNTSEVEVRRIAGYGKRELEREMVDEFGKIPFREVEGYSMVLGTCDRL